MGTNSITLSTLQRSRTATVQAAATSSNQPPVPSRVISFPLPSLARQPGLFSCPASSLGLSGSEVIGPLMGGTQSGAEKVSKRQGGSKWNKGETLKGQGWG